MPAFIALGSNLGHSQEILGAAIARLERLSSVPVLRSSFWRTTPVDCPPGSPDFLNAVIGMQPLESLTPESLLGALQEVEREFGRRPKTVLNEARPLDVDLIAWDTQTLESAQLVLPHPRAHSRRFVLAPLAEIAPDFIIPGQQKSVRELLATLRTDEQIERLI